jgi:4-alpha-glucanotransferase
MNIERSSGILLHPTSLPGNFGIGDIGPAALRFVDFLSNTGCRLWQILPFGPTGFGNSPYQSFSAFAGNPYLISPELLIQDNLLHLNDLTDKPNFSSGRVDYGKVIPWKLEILKRTFNNFSSLRSPLLNDFQLFCDENSYWLEDYSFFMALKEANGERSWIYWPESILTRNPRSLSEAREKLKSSVLRYQFYQFLFFRQWSSLKIHAEKAGIKIIGDIPLYISHDSADAWAHPNLFRLNSKGIPIVVAGVPPDYFSRTGQLWGNPLYQWDAHERTGYQWWIKRIKWILKSVDMVRLDHFRGFSSYWEIPAGNPTAETGQWVAGPGRKIFKAIESSLRKDGGLPFIAEDLGIITPDVVELREEFKFPGMKILQFAFSDTDNPFLPHNYKQNCVVYTGTHDNDTTIGWFNMAHETEKIFARKYMGVLGTDIAWDLIRIAWASSANYAITPMQDLLGIDSGGRMNFPNTLEGNWEWRLVDGSYGDKVIERLQDFNEIYGRK